MKPYAPGTNLVTILSVSLFLSTTSAQKNWQMAAPDRRAVLTVRLAPAGGEGRLFLDVAYGGKPRAEGCTARHHSQ
jgi:hypothetical protein